MSKPSLYKQIKSPDWFHYPHIYDKIYEGLPDYGTFVEIGAFLGVSTAYMAELIKTGLKKLYFFSVDLWMPSNNPEQYLLDEIYSKQHNIYPIFIQNMKDLGLREFVTPISMDSVKASDIFSRETIDAIMFDGDHSETGIRRDIKAWHPKVKQGGILAGDDYGHECFPGIKKVVHELLEPVEIIEPLDETVHGHKLWWHRKK